MSSSKGAVPSGHQTVIVLDASRCLPSLFDPGNAKPLTYSASLVASEVVALMVSARVKKNTRVQRRPQVTWVSPVTSPAQWVPAGLKMARRVSGKALCLVTKTAPTFTLTMPTQLGSWEGLSLSHLLLIWAHRGCSQCKYRGLSC